MAKGDGGVGPNGAWGKKAGGGLFKRHSTFFVRAKGGEGGGGRSRTFSIKNDEESQYAGNPRQEGSKGEQRDHQGDAASKVSLVVGVS